MTATEKEPCASTSVPSSVGFGGEALQTFGDSGGYLLGIVTWQYGREPSCV